jgi:putative ABC transport system permease protein
VIQQKGALPSGTSAPNTVITEHAISQLGLGSSVSTSGWLILAPHPLTAAQITSARLTAAGQGLSIETKSSAPSSAEILNWATLFGFVLALGIVAMSVGLIRSETAGDLRTLTATGASGWTRRTLTAVTAGALGLAGAVLGTAAAYLGAAGYSFGNHLDGLGELGSVPTWNLLVILVGLPLVAAAAGWLLAGREPSTMARQPLESESGELTGAGPGRRHAWPGARAPGSPPRRAPRIAAGRRPRPCRHRPRSRSGWPGRAGAHRRPPA